jgi:hypothetical protein
MAADRTLHPFAERILVEFAELAGSIDHALDDRQHVAGDRRKFALAKR